MKYRHYAPRAEMIIVGGAAGAVQEKIRELSIKCFQHNGKAGIIASRRGRGRAGEMVRYACFSPEVIARRLFPILRDLDKAVDLILDAARRKARIGMELAGRRLGVASEGAFELLPGLPCEDCGAPTHETRAEIRGFGKCPHRVTVARDGPRTASAARCPRCKP